MIDVTDINVVNMPPPLASREKGEGMDNLGIAGLLQTYAERAAKATTTSQLRRIIKELREELDLRKVRMDDK
jgi:hypothetical protein